MWKLVQTYTRLYSHGGVHYAIIPHYLQLELVVSCEPAAGVTPVPVIRERIRTSGSELWERQ